MTDAACIRHINYLREGTVMMTIAVDNAAALGSDIFLEDSWY
jgi:hypothetical protein